MKVPEMKIAFIGGGNMGEAILASLISKGTSAPQNISVAEVSGPKRDYLSGKYGVRAVGKSADVIDGCDVVVLAVKPQSFPAVAAEIGGRLSPGQLVISIMAGIRLPTLITGLKHRVVVRSMPNTPAQIGQGITVWTATPEVSQEQKDSARAILTAMGQEVFVKDESFIDMATAVSGSGPAYLFLFVEALAEAGVNIGLPPDVSEKLVRQTVLGSAMLLERSGLPPAELRRRVTSPGGTTAAALSKFEQGRFNELVREAVAAAFRRAQELGG